MNSSGKPDFCRTSELTVLSCDIGLEYARRPLRLAYTFGFLTPVLGGSGFFAWPAFFVACAAAY
jgi:hypothetical protein